MTPVVWVMANLKGGSGKTSLAVHLAATASQRGIRVLLVDTDPTLSAKRWSEIAEMEFECKAAGKRELLSVIKSSRAGLVIVDTPAVMADVVVTALGEADMVLIPMHTGSGDIDQVADTDQLLTMPRRVNPDLPVRVVMNHTRKIPTLDRDTRQVVEEYGLRVCKRDIPFLKEYAAAKGRPILPEQAQHFRELFDEILGEMSTDAKTKVGAVEAVGAVTK